MYKNLISHLNKDIHKIKVECMFTICNIFKYSNDYNINQLVKDGSFELILSKIYQF